MSPNQPERPSPAPDGATVSVIVRALNEAEHIGRLLASIQAQSVLPDEVILVDSGSTDGTVAIAEQFGAAITHIPPSEFTFGRALNWGCEQAKGEVLVFVSAHVYPLDPSWLAKLIEPFSDDDVALSYGGQTGDHRSNFAEIRLLEAWFPDEPNPDQSEPFCNNANCAVRRSVWQELGYDESLPGLEDIAFGRQVLETNRRISYVPDARIAHVHEEGFRQTLNRYRREAMAYQTIFGKAEMSLLKALGLATVNAAGDAAAVVRSRQFEDALPALKFRIAQFLGAYLGHRTSESQSKQVIRRMYYPRG